MSAGLPTLIVVCLFVLAATHEPWSTGTAEDAGATDAVQRLTELQHAGIDDASQCNEERTASATLPSRSAAFMASQPYWTRWRNCVSVKNWFPVL